MDLGVTLLIVGIALLLVGSVGKMQAKELKTGTRIKVAPVVIALASATLLVISFADTPAQTTELPDGIYTIQQKINSRYVDAYETGGRRDYGLVTRERQNDLSQRWMFRRVSDNTYTIQQMSNGRYVDAYETPGFLGKYDYGLVTRTEQGDKSQKWILLPGGGDNVYTIQQKVNGRYVDAHGSKKYDYRLVTREEQNDDSQRWVIKRP